MLKTEIKSLVSVGKMLPLMEAFYTIQGEGFHKGTAAYKIQKNPFVVPTTDGKLIEEHFGKATDGNTAISIAHMEAPPGWSEPFQKPEFDEYTYITVSYTHLTLPTIYSV